MSASRWLSLVTVLAGAMAPAAFADGRNPGSVLVYTVQRSGPQFFTVISISNSNTTKATPTSFGGSTELHYEYMNSVRGQDPFEPCSCTVFNRVEFLTPGDHLSVVTACHNATLPAGQEGYLVVSARNPALFESPWSFNFLMGSELVINAAGGTYSLNAIPFRSPQGTYAPTDISPADSQLQFDGIEYEGVPDVLYIDSFIALTGSQLALLNLTGGAAALNTVQMTVWNDNEFALSSTRPFRCWFDQPLTLVSPLFEETYLKNATPDDPDEMRLNCDGLGTALETGWARLDSIDVESTGGFPISGDGAILGSITAGPDSFIDGGHLLWESRAKQSNGQSIQFGGGAGIPCAPGDNLPPVCLITTQPLPGSPPGIVDSGVPFEVCFTVTDPDDAQVTVQLTKTPDRDNPGNPAVLSPPGGLVNTPYMGCVQWTPEEGDEDEIYTFEIKVTDSGGLMTTCEFQIGVTPPDDFFCVDEKVITFDEYFLNGVIVPDGTPGSAKLPAGTIITDQYEADFSVRISAQSATNTAMIFDSFNPTGGDVDLGTPNGIIDGGVGNVPGAPGVGNGPGAGFDNDDDNSDGEGHFDNNDPATGTPGLGNLLILQEPGASEPDDDAAGGTITIEFINGMKAAVTGFKIVDAEELPFLGEVRLYDSNGPIGGPLLIPGIGDNSVQTIDNPDFQGMLADPQTVKIEIEFFGSGSLGQFRFCETLDP